MGDLTTLRGTPAYAAGKIGNAMSGGVLGAATATEWDSPVGTLEFWCKTTSASTRVAVGSNGSASNGTWVGTAGSGNANFAYGSSTGTTSISIIDGAWHHLALTADGTNYKLWVDGVLGATVALAVPFSMGSGSGVGTPAIGGFGTTAGYDWPGQIDEVRISNSVRYTSTFTPPTTAFTADGNTKALYHLEADGTDSGKTTLLPNDTSIVYSPFTWDVTSTRAKTILPGAYFRFAITGATCALNFDMTGEATPYPELKYRVDGGGWTTVTLAAVVNLTMPTDNSWGTHVVEVAVKATSEFVSRWSPQSAHVSLTGIAATAFVTQEAATLKVLVFGDSITEGYKTLQNVTTPTGSDATVGWAFQLGRLLGAEVGNVGYGGNAWLTGGGVAGVPALPSHYNLLWGGGPTRSLTSPAPDVIVINEGENDTGDVTSTVTSFLNTLLSATPATTRIVVMRPFSGAHASELSAAVTAVANSRVSYMDTTGWFNTADSADGQHPYGYTNVAKLGPRVASAVRTVLTRGATWINVGGVAKAASIIRR